MGSAEPGKLLHMATLDRGMIRIFLAGPGGMQQGDRAGSAYLCGQLS